jgi:hypothetical protein
VSPQDDEKPVSDELSPRDVIFVALAMAGCLLGAVGIWVVILGVPIGLYHGVTTGDWTWLAAVGVLAIVLAIGEKSGLMKSLND